MAGLLVRNDLHHPEVIAGRMAVSYLVQYGYIADYGGTVDKSYPVLYNYKHNYTDTEFVQTAISRGCFCHAAKSIVEHLHPCWGFGTDDAGYKKSRETMAEDDVIFNSRRHLWAG